MAPLLEGASEATKLPLASSRIIRPDVTLGGSARARTWRKEGRTVVVACDKEATGDFFIVEALFILCY